MFFFFFVFVFVSNSIYVCRFPSLCFSTCFGGYVSIVFVYGDFHYRFCSYVDFLGFPVLLECYLHVYDVYSLDCFLVALFLHSRLDCVICLHAMVVFRICPSLLLPLMLVFPFSIPNSPFEVVVIGS